MKKRFAVVDTVLCVACGCCVKVCPRQAITVPKGIFAEVERAQCVGCGLCAKACPASVIEIMQEETP
ncbi:MAG: 4Fe-4S binding protein [Butyricicoccus pullicaecorum]|nr:4Fe-4S binding protein [Butyricicoccus pullicaecorum]